VQAKKAQQLPIYPFVYAIWLSFSDKMVGTEAHFVGLKNFRYVITWPQFTAALYNTGVFTVVAIMCKFVLGMAVALVLNQHIRGRNFFRAFLLLPWVMPAFVVYLVCAGCTIRYKACSITPRSTWA
jgi:ABC-type sugar transport system permease subunit